MQRLIQLTWFIFRKRLKWLQGESKGWWLPSVGCGWVHFQFYMTQLASIRLRMHGCAYDDLQKTTVATSGEILLTSGAYVHLWCRIWVSRSVLGSVSCAPCCSEAPSQSQASVSEPLASGHQLVIGEGVILSTCPPCKDIIPHLLGLELLSRRRKSLNLTLDEW